MQNNLTAKKLLVKFTIDVKKADNFLLKACKQLINYILLVFILIIALVVLLIIIICDFYLKLKHPRLYLVYLFEKINGKTSNKNFNNYLSLHKFKTAIINLK